LVIDGTVKTTFQTAYTRGDELVTGLESYDPNMTFPTFASYTLKYRIVGGSFRYWAGKDGGYAEGPVCGRWYSSTSWWAGENTSCA
jgi:hypothetical protein